MVDGGDLDLYAVFIEFCVDFTAYGRRFSELWSLWSRVE